MLPRHSVCGAATREFNLYHFDLFPQSSGNLCSVRVYGLEQTVGAETRSTMQKRFGKIWKQPNREF